MNITVERFLQGAIGLENLNCELFFSGDGQTGELFIECRDRAAYDAIFCRRDEICLRLSSYGVNVKLNGSILLRCEPRKGASEMFAERLALPLNGGGLIQIPSRHELFEFVNANPPVKVIRWDGIGLASGDRCVESSGLTPEQWQGRSMDEEIAPGVRTWIPEEWARFQKALFDHSQITEFQYRAHLYTGELVLMTVNASLGFYGEPGALIRVVETLQVDRI